MTDGHVSKRFVSIKLQKSDEDVLLKIKDKLNHTGPIYYRKTYNELRIYNKKLIASLVDIGYTLEDKTLTCQPPDLPDEFKPDFLRGCFEGDGNINRKSCGSLRVNFCGASERLVSYICDLLNEFSIETYYQKGKTDFFDIRTRNTPSALRWAFLMYKNSDTTNRMNRKFMNYQSYLGSYFDMKRVNTESIKLVTESVKHFDQSVELTA